MTPRVLIVEDEEMTSVTMSKLFQLWGWSPRRATTIADAIEALHTDPPHLVMLDLVLPDGDGIEVLCAIRTRPPEAQPKVFVTTAKELEGLHALLDLNPDQLLHKPFSLLVLQAFADSVWELAQRTHVEPDLWSGLE